MKLYPMICAILFICFVNGKSVSKSETSARNAFVSKIRTTVSSFYTAKHVELITDNILRRICFKQKLPQILTDFRKILKLDTSKAVLSQGETIMRNVDHCARNAFSLTRFEWGSSFKTITASLHPTVEICLREIYAKLFHLSSRFPSSAKCVTRIDLLYEVANDFWSADLVQKCLMISVFRVSAEEWKCLFDEIHQFLILDEYLTDYYDIVRLFQK